MARPGQFKEGWEKMQRNDEIFRGFAEDIAKLPCVLPGSKSCQEKDDYSHTLWCASCRARDALEQVNKE